MAEPMQSRIAVVGVSGDTLSTQGGQLVDGANLVVGGDRLLDGFAPPGRRRLVLNGDLKSALDRLEDEPGPVCVLASGDPGFFGIVRVLTERFGSERLDVHPAPSSVSIAFARLGLPWDDAVVVSAHGRPLVDAARTAVAGAPKVAVLTSPESPPEALGQSLLDLGASFSRVAVCSQLGGAQERVHDISLTILAAGRWDPLSVVVLLNGKGVAAEATLAWGLPEASFDHRGGMVTKAEVRAVALGKLAIPSTGVLWDVGAGSASVAIECARLAPRLEVFAIERRPDDVERARANAATHGVVISVIDGAAPAALESLPSPDRAFVGGGGLPILDAVLARLVPGGRVVGTYSALDRAAAAFQRLGHMAQVTVNRACGLPDGGVRLAAENPVFVAWGPPE
ncbi:MAG TPA: precorrin-6y C5,15-methyltransferase (decarboxylating) subunit CbiE [Acidimicrobiales bacterium]|nr:precorrin-6y C5,15-methyltransferase (decarboxylating) subunit CbiE [Acidimicrobiales bacterium]